MGNYTIRYATQEDIPVIKRFVNENWKKDHILAREAGFLGIKLLMYLMDKELHRTVFSLEINVKTTRDIYERLQFSMGRMNQWYCLRKLESYAVAKVVDEAIPQYIHFDNVKIIRYYTFEDMLVDFD